MGKLQTIVQNHDIMSDTVFQAPLKKPELCQRVSYIL
jgi:hypothetical protein